MTAHGALEANGAKGAKGAIAVIGGGAAGLFAAIQAAELAQSNGDGPTVTIYEAGSQPLAKVRIAGGGRCNVTHHCFDPTIFAQAYPRGQRELRAAFGRFQARDLVDWFGQRGVALHSEADGRMFPTTNDSATIANALLEAARQAGVRLQTRCAVRSIRCHDTGYLMRSDQGEVLVDKVLLASGGSRSAMELAAQLGHTILPPVPALFTLRCQDPLIRDLAGIACPATVTIHAPDGALHQASGPLLITHWGFSGPAVLKASSWAARDLAAGKWQGQLAINWLPQHSEQSLREHLRQRRQQDAGKLITTVASDDIPKRLWERLCARSETIGKWGETSNASLEQLLHTLRNTTLAISGKGPFKEEFVVCGGIKRQEIDWRRMESRIHHGLHFAGEVIDQDGLTGGFNLQAAWTTGWIAGRAMAQDC